MSKLIHILLFIFMLICVPHTNASARNSEYQRVTAFCYHDVVTPDRHDVLNSDRYAISTARLEEHFKLYKKLGYTPISLQQYDDYLEGRGELPDKPILLTFDDGRESMYRNIYPLLKKYGYPAVYAVILSYMDILPADIEKMVTWDQLNEMAASGLVEVASHSYNLHNFVVANPYGNRNHNVTTIWWNESNVYESEKSYERRILSDLKKGTNILKENFHYPVNCIVWPFGANNGFAKKAAEDYGYKYQLMLNDDAKLDSERTLSRFIIFDNPSDKEIQSFLEHKYGKKELKAAQIDIDALYDSLPEQFERNIEAAIDKMIINDVNTVFLQAFADGDGDGNVDAVYFHTDKMPVLHDVFSHVAIRFKERGLMVYAWMPILSYSHMTENDDEVITASSSEKAGWYRRATPFSPKVREHAKALVKDLAMYAPIDGILFQDDLYMNDFEDFSIYGKRAFEKQFGMQLSLKALEDKELQGKWARYKTEFLNSFTHELIQTAKYYRPELKTARNIYSIVVTNPESEVWFAQNYDDFLELYDYVVIMAYPEMEKAANDEEWLNELVKSSIKNKLGREKAVFKLQGYDWSKGVWIKDSVQERRSKVIRRAGGKNLAQYPVNVFGD